MTQRSDIDRVLEIWMDDGPTAISDRVVDVIAARIGVQRQRRAWPFHWRTTMAPIKLIAGLAAVIVVAVAGYNLLPKQPSVGGPSPTPSATPSPTQTPAATPRTYTGQLFQGTTTWTLIIPDGWRALASNTIVPDGDQSFAGPTGIGIGFSDATNVPQDPCDAVGAPSDATSVADVVAALRARDDLVVSNETETTLGGFSGTRVDVEAPADLSACPDGSWFLFAEPDGDGFYAQGPSNMLRYWILDVDGHVVMVFLQRFADTPAERLAEAQQIIDSIQITP